VTRTLARLLAAVVATGTVATALVTGAGAAQAAQAAQTHAAVVSSPARSGSPIVTPDDWWW